jgi:hypothetical protein
MYILLCVEVQFDWCKYILFLMIINWDPKSFVGSGLCMYICEVM